EPLQHSLELIDSSEHTARLGRLVPERRTIDLFEERGNLALQPFDHWCYHLLGQLLPEMRDKLARRAEIARGARIWGLCSPWAWRLLCLFFDGQEGEVDVAFPKVEPQELARARAFSHDQAGQRRDHQPLDRALEGAGAVERMEARGSEVLDER